MKLTLSEQIVTTRRRLRLTQHQAAKMVGVEYQTYQHAERGMIAKKNESKFKLFIQQHIEENSNEKRKN